jgi:hypothetical protein
MKAQTRVRVVALLVSVVGFLGAFAAARANAGDRGDKVVANGTQLTGIRGIAGAE